MNKFGALLSQADLEEIRFGKTAPQPTYAFTKAEPGTLASPASFNYSEQMYFQFLFARFHSVDHGAKRSYIKGRLAGREVFHIPLELNRQDNQWVPAAHPEAAVPAHRPHPRRARRRPEPRREQRVPLLQPHTVRETHER